MFRQPQTKQGCLCRVLQCIAVFCCGFQAFYLPFEQPKILNIKGLIILTSFCRHLPRLISLKSTWYLSFLLCLIQTTHYFLSMHDSVLRYITGRLSWSMFLLANNFDTEFEKLVRHTLTLNVYIDKYTCKHGHSWMRTHSDSQHPGWSKNFSWGRNHGNRGCRWRKPFYTVKVITGYHSNSR